MCLSYEMEMILFWIKHGFSIPRVLSSLWRCDVGVGKWVLLNSLEPGSLNSEYYSYYSLLLLAWCLSSLQPVVREGQSMLCTRFPGALVHGLD